MEVKGRKVVLSRKEVEEEGLCPINRRWAIAALKLFGPTNNPRSRLYFFSRCPEVLKEAGYQVEIMESEKE